MEGALFVVLIAVAVAAGVGIPFYLKQKRRNELAAMARQLGLEFSPEDVLGCLGLPFRLFTRGDGRGVENVMWGTWQQMPVRQFDYWYYDESTDAQGRRSRTYHRFSCAVTELEAACSPITIEREDLLTRLADAIGLDDLEFELEAFNRAFNVKAKDRRFAVALCDQRMMRFLLGTDPAFAFEACGPWLLCYSKRRRPTDLIPLLGTLKGFRDHVPRVVFDLYPRSG
ncbi:MAG: hypothetical protein KatS3mg014_0919 [Actinomycetota bacterium]|nr:MAG: hypothetical protein KatS3mg014_0919 [Actinomycetota bacterium]